MRNQPAHLRKYRADVSLVAALPRDRRGGPQTLEECDVLHDNWNRELSADKERWYCLCGSVCFLNKRASGASLLAVTAMSKAKMNQVGLRSSQVRSRAPTAQVASMHNQKIRST